MIYTCICTQCSKQEDRHAAMADRDNITSNCCGVATTRKLIAPMVSAGVWTGHKGFVTTDKRWIESASDAKAYMREKNLVPFEEGKQEATRVKADTEKSHEQKLNKVVAEAIAEHT